MFLKYRLHTPEELTKRNKCSMFQVVKAVIIQHAIQTAAGIAFVYFDPQEMTGMEDFDIWRIQYFFALCCGIGPKGYVQSFTPISSIFRVLGLSSLRFSHSAAWLVYYGIIPLQRSLLHS